MAALAEHCDVLEGVLNNCCTRTNEVYSALPSICYQSVSLLWCRQGRKKVEIYCWCKLSSCRETWVAVLCRRMWIDKILLKACQTWSVARVVTHVVWCVYAGSICWLALCSITYMFKPEASHCLHTRCAIYRRICARLNRMSAWTSFWQDTNKDPHMAPSLTTSPLPAALSATCLPHELRRMTASKGITHSIRAALCRPLCTM